MSSDMDLLPPGQPIRLVLKPSGVATLVDDDANAMVLDLNVDDVGTLREAWRLLELDQGRSVTMDEFLACLWLRAVRAREEVPAA